MFRRIIIMAAFAALQKFLINKVDFQPLKKFFEGLLDPAKKVADILTDKNPANTQQLAEFWRENQHLLTDGGLDTAIEILKAKIKDDEVRNLVVGILEELKNEG